MFNRKLLVIVFILIPAIWFFSDSESDSLNDLKYPISFEDLEEFKKIKNLDGKFNDNSMNLFINGKKFLQVGNESFPEIGEALDSCNRIINATPNMSKIYSAFIQDELIGLGNGNNNILSGVLQLSTKSNIYRQLTPAMRIFFTGLREDQVEYLKDLTLDDQQYLKAQVDTAKTSIKSGVIHSENGAIMMVSTFCLGLDLQFSMLGLNLTETEATADYLAEMLSNNAKKNLRKNLNDMESYLKENN